MFAVMLDLSGFALPSLLPLWIGIIILPFLVQLDSKHLAVLGRLGRHLFVAVLLALAIGSVKVYAFDMFRECDFEALVSEYGYWVAWAWWVGSQCYI